MAMVGQDRRGDLSGTCRQPPAVMSIVFIIGGQGESRSCHSQNTCNTLAKLPVILPGGAHLLCPLHTHSGVFCRPPAKPSPPGGDAHYDLLLLHHQSLLKLAIPPEPLQLPSPTVLSTRSYSTSLDEQLTAALVSPSVPRMKPLYSLSLSFSLSLATSRAS